MFAGGREAPGPVHVDSCHSELVPPSGSNVGQLDPLVGGLQRNVAEHNQPSYPDGSVGWALKEHHGLSPCKVALSSLCPWGKCGHCAPLREELGGRQGISRAFHVFNSTARKLPPKS